MANFWWLFFATGCSPNVFEQLSEVSILFLELLEVLEGVRESLGQNLLLIGGGGRLRRLEEGRRHQDEEQQQPGGQQQQQQPHPHHAPIFTCCEHKPKSKSITGRHHVGEQNISLIACWDKRPTGASKNDRDKKTDWEGSFWFFYF